MTLGNHIIANLALGLWFLADAVRFAYLAQSFSSSIVEILTCVSLLLLALFVLTRKAPQSQDVSITSIAIAFIATFWPLLMVLMADTKFTPSNFSISLQVLSCLIILFSVLSLRWNFSIIPQYRTLTKSGPYGIVRHPLYAAYILFDATIALEIGSFTAWFLWFCEGAILSWRAYIEESFLEAQDANYISYKQSVRYRFVPFVF